MRFPLGFLFFNYLPALFVSAESSKHCWSEVPVGRVKMGARQRENWCWSLVELVV